MPPASPSDPAERERRRLELLWTGQQHGSRGPKAGLELTDIVRIGIELADAEGLPAVSMNRLAKELGSGVMSLYRYVPGKSELVDLMADTVVGETSYPATPPEGWRPRMELAARSEWARYHRHPWLLSVVATTQLPLGPHTVSEIEWSLRAVDELDLDATRKLWVVMTISAFVQGAALLLVDARKGPEAPASFDDYPDLADTLQSVGASTMLRLGSAWEVPLDLEAWFEFGLQHTLDGIAASVRKA